MLDFPLWKRLWLWGVTLFFALAAVPSLLAIGGVRLPEIAEIGRASCRERV